MRSTAEQQRLEESRTQGIPWKKWGPYLSERQWGRCAKITAGVVMHGTTSPITKPVHVPTAGV